MIGVKNDEALAVTRFALAGAGCCIICTGQFFLSLIDDLPDIPWLRLVAQVEPDSEVLDYVRDPALYEQ